MRRITAIFLLFCFGLILPTAGIPMRICLSPNIGQGGLVVSLEEKPSKSHDCCPGCLHTKEDDSCCIISKKLPDCQEVLFPFSLSPFFAIAPLETLAAPILPETELLVFSPATPIRGPDAQHSRLAMLQTWLI